MNLAVEELLSALTADSIPAALRFLLSTAAPDKAIASIRENIQFESLCQSGYLLLILSIILIGVSDKRGGDQCVGRGVSLMLDESVDS